MPVTVIPTGDSTEAKQIEAIEEIEKLINSNKELKVVLQKSNQYLLCLVGDDNEVDESDVEIKEKA